MTLQMSKMSNRFWLGTWNHARVEYYFIETYSVLVKRPVPLTFIFYSSFEGYTK